MNDIAQRHFDGLRFALEQSDEDERDELLYSLVLLVLAYADPFKVLGIVRRFIQQARTGEGT